jgi:hypothetical protein
MITWDEVGTRRFESGVDRGVLYPPNGEPVAWSGLTSVVEKMKADVEGVYFDGMRIGNAITYGEYSAELSCITYPYEFETLQGTTEIRQGVLLGDQPLQTFGLCYRTLVGSDTGGDEAAYKLHIVYNLIAVPSDKTYTSQSDDPSLVEYSYTLVAIPEEAPGFRPTAQIVVKSDDVYPWLLEDLEAMLYGSDEMTATLIPMRQMTDWLKNWARVKINVNAAEGTWTATSDKPGYVFLLDDDTILIQGANAFFEDEYETTFIIDDTVEDPDLYQFEIIDHGGATWTAKSNHLGVIVEFDDGSFEIQDADPVFAGPDIFRIKTKKLG